MAHALVPLKDLVQAKTRLAGLLAPSERRALAQAMLEDVLVLLAGHPEIEGITLVSDDPSAHLLAGQYGARHWPERELGCRGLNEVVGLASARLQAEGAAALLVLHADLPLLGTADVAAVLATQREIDGLAIGCDRHGAGTNVLAYAADRVPRFCFGPDSCAGHFAAARADGIPAAVLRRPGIGLDIDEPQDLAFLLAQLDRAGRGHTAALLRGTGLGGRISLALASMAPLALFSGKDEVC